MKPIISIVGKTNSGKTTLIERIVPELKNRGYRVGTIKHDVHQFDIDHKGKDTYRMSTAGADTVVIASKEKMAMVKMVDHEYPIDHIVQMLFTDVDIVITEGFKKQDKPKIEVSYTGELLCSKDNNLIGIVDNTPPGAVCRIPSNCADIPCFKMGEASCVVDLIEAHVKPEHAVLI